jgi:hypothetical protein
MDNRKISLLIGSAYRANQLRRTLDALLSTVDRPVELCISLIDNDFDSHAVIRGLNAVYMPRTFEEYGRGAIYATNKLYRRSSGSIIALWADDLMPQAGWLDQALEALDSIGGDGIVGYNDGSGDTFAAHFMITRPYVRAHGDLIFPPMYRSWWCDREMSEIARREGKFAITPRPIVTHNTHLLGRSENDRTYRDAALNHEADRLLYEQRKAAGFPPDWYTPDANTIVLPDEPERAEVVATNSRKYSKGSMGRSNRLLANGE